MTHLRAPVQLLRLLPCQKHLIKVFGAISGLLVAFAYPLYVYACAVEGATAYQPSLQEVAGVFEKAGSNTLGTSYPALPPLEAGYPDERNTQATVPCVIIKAIGYVESSWQQAAGSVPEGKVGPVKVSSSCGYGIMQITSGMQRAGALPTDAQGRIASDYVYNIGWGAAVLAGKWNYGPDYIPPIGDRDPAIAENWYYAVWAYNGLLFKNNPNNPDLPWPRVPFSGTQNRTNYPYQELVWGFAANPPSVRGSMLWEPIPLTLPRREEVGLEPQPFPTPQPSHRAPCRILKVAPGSLHFFVQPGQKSSPQTLLLEGAVSQNPGGWKAMSESGWLSFSPSAGGALPMVISLYADAKSLGPGIYAGSLKVSLADSGAEAVVVPLQLHVVTLREAFLPWMGKRTPISPR